MEHPRTSSLAARGLDGAGRRQVRTEEVSSRESEGGDSVAPDPVAALNDADFELATQLEAAHIACFCGSRRGARALLGNLDVVLKTVAHASRPPLSLVVVFGQVESVLTLFLGRPYAPFFLKQLLLSPSFSAFDYMFEPLILELARHCDIVDLCSHRRKYLFVLALLAHVPSSATWNTRELENNILKERNRERMFTSKTGGIWVAGRIVARRPDMHASLAIWLCSWPKILLSAMTSGCVAQILVADYDAATTKSASGRRAAALIIDALWARPTWVLEKLVGDARFQELKDAVMRTSPAHRIQIQSLEAFSDRGYWQGGWVEW